MSNQQNPLTLAISSSHTSPLYSHSRPSPSQLRRSSASSSSFPATCDLSHISLTPSHSQSLTPVTRDPRATHDFLSPFRVSSLDPQIPSFARGVSVDVGKFGLLGKLGLLGSVYQCGEIKAVWEIGAVGEIRVIGEIGAVGEYWEKKRTCA
ncbi:hypothetical protein DVH24_011997 [Malus domestica]|uniref:Uncharacterized protein n=1 Tax=Malus domestica TaxID=3750 RepID=A0A498JGP3_MALDO|nr:hypothetical protein DVH24_011997 [Malus domestica]